MSTTFQPQETVPFCALTEERWLVILRVSALLINFFIALLCIIDMMTIEFDIPAIILNLYLTAFAAMCTFTELRFIKMFRVIIYPFVKWFYFLTLNASRGVAYFFTGTLMIEGTVWSKIVAVAAMILGVMWVVIANFYKITPIPDKETPGVDAAHREHLRRDQYALQRHQRQQEYQDYPTNSNFMPAPATGVVSGVPVYDPAATPSGPREYELAEFTHTPDYGGSGSAGGGQQQHHQDNDVVFKESTQPPAAAPYPFQMAPQDHPNPFAEEEDPK